MSRVQRLTKALLADRNRKVTAERTDITHCFMCGFGMLYRGSRFCSVRCRGCYDAGEPGHEQDWLLLPKPESLPLTELKVIAGPPGVELGASLHKLIFGDRKLPATPMQRSAAGYMIRCAGCGKDFEGKGLRWCSVDCEHRYKERQENLALMAKVGVEPTPKKLCANPECRARIPTWRKGRKVSSSTRFCSPKCQQKARRQSSAEKAVLNAETAKKAA
jgi:hypothetical protein